MTSVELDTLHAAIHEMDAELDALFDAEGHSDPFEALLARQEEMTAALLDGIERGGR